MKKIALRITSCVLLVAIFISSMVFAQAEPTLVTQAKLDTSISEYYDLVDGIYTKKTVQGPFNAGTKNEYYDVTLDTYTSDVSIISSVEKKEVDLMLLIDASLSSIDNRFTTLEEAKTTLNKLVTDYGVGTTAKVNVAAVAFSDFSVKTLDYTTLNASTIKDTGAIGSKLNAITMSGTLNSYLADGLQTAEKEIVSRKKSHPNNKQIVLFFTDGAPSALDLTSVISNDTNIFPVEEMLANNAIKAANSLKSKGVEIYAIGFGNGFKPMEYNTHKMGLAAWTTSGYYSWTGDGIIKLIKDGGYKVRPRQIGIMMNLISSNWLPNAGQENKEFNFYTDATLFYDKDNVQSVYNSYTGLSAVLERAFRYKEWVQNNNDITNAQDYYHINPEIEGKAGYYFSSEDSSGISAAVASALKNAIKETFVCQGNLLQDLYIKDTTSDYFEVIEGSQTFYKVPYTGGYKYSSDTSKENYQYGAEDRKFGTPTQITGINSYIENDKKTLVVKGYDNASQITDTFRIVDDNVNDNGEHSGSMFRVKYRIRPVDQFMGGKNVPVANESKSGIYKNYAIVQNFDHLSFENGKEVITRKFNPIYVPLVKGQYFIPEKNVKIGLIYEQTELIKGGYYEYEGRHSTNKYQRRYSEEDNGNLVFNESNERVDYTHDFITLTLIITSGEYIQPLNSSEQPSVNVYCVTYFMDAHNTDYGEEPDDIFFTSLRSYHNWKNSGVDSVVFTDDENPRETSGAKNGVHYASGKAVSFTTEATAKLNVFVPVILTDDMFISNQSSISAIPASLSVNAFALTNDIDNDGLTEDRFAQIKYNNGVKEIVPDYIEVVDPVTNEVRLDYHIFASDVLGFDKANLGITGKAVKCFDENGNEKTASDKLENKDKISISIDYTAMKAPLAAFIAENGLSANDFSTEITDFYTYSLCTVCNEADSDERQQYQIKVHSTSNSITVNKTGCDANHPNDSFVFTVLGAKELSDGSIDTSSIKAITTFALHGNGTQTVPVDASEYKYFKVIEDTNCVANDAWTWNYNGLKINDTVINAGYNTNTDEGFFKLGVGESETLTFENVYNSDYNVLHYSSGYCTNILKAGTKIEINNSHDSFMTEEPTGR